MNTKEVFLEAAKIIESSIEYNISKLESGDIIGTRNCFMCNVIADILDLPNSVYIPISYTNSGFNRINYHKFIKKNYPDLISALEFHASPWILVVGSESPGQCLKSKVEFLKHLANEVRV